MSDAAALGEDLVRVCAVGSLVVASDFDGVLAPFVLDPLDARPQPGTLEDLRALDALPSTTAVLVSGRDLSTLTALTDGPDDGLVRIGSHGAESSRVAQTRLTDETSALLARVRSEVTAALRDRGVSARVEDKPAAVVLHSRGVSPADAEVVAGIAEQAEQIDGVRLLRGKDVHELAVVTADKGSALRALTDELGADAFVYLGDDVTDEHVFEVAGPADVTIKVGPGSTAARHRVERVEDVPAVIAEVRQLREAR